MFFMSPLGDRFERRSLILFMVLCECVSLALASVAPSLLVLCGASLAIGLPRHDRAAGHPFHGRALAP